MRVNRRFMYLGIFLVAMGGALVAADLGDVDTTTIADALRLWPLAIVALGIGVVLRRTRFSLPGGMLAVAVPGLLLGGGFALAPRIGVDCDAGGVPSTMAIHEGVFEGPARVSVTTGCGVLVVNTERGGGWQFEAGNTASRTPIVDASGSSLSIAAGGSEDWHAFDRGRDTWRLTLPTTAIEELFLDVNVGEGRVTLPGAQIGRLDLTTNAGSTTVDLSEATVASLVGTVNAGALSFRLAAADVVGTFEVNAGALELCVPEDLGMRVRHDGALSGISINGVDQTGNEWQSPSFASAEHRADFTIDVNLGSVEINPIGGCK